ncbi:hypothetical protein SEEN6799_03889 [Salmonella enterica subsp. enterica serovar Newport str. 36799]|nr:hypothetical protein SEEN6799_03889 [Salmonella enterica subsp. enterica serovar Newport str. 36799]
MTAVYPRWRGEHCRVYARDNKVTGLSPLARGTHRTNLFFLFLFGLSPLARGTRAVPGLNTALTRFIPAGAGNTETDCIPCAMKAVYPRWRGEHTGMPSDPT